MPRPQRRVWIESGCIRCAWCENLCPSVFAASPQGTRIRAEARRDGKLGTNARERSPLPPGVLGDAEWDFLAFVAGGCPAQVIRIEEAAASAPPVAGSPDRRSARRA